MSDVKITAYNVKTKEKGVDMLDAVITKTAKGAYMAQGHDGKGNKHYPDGRRKSNGRY